MSDSRAALFESRHLSETGVAKIPSRVMWLARALRERRLSLGENATQQVIAAHANISLRQLQKIEQGAAIPRLDTLLALTDALDTDLQSMLDRAETLRRRSIKPRSSRRDGGASRAGSGR